MIPSGRSRLRNGLAAGLLGALTLGPGSAGAVERLTIVASDLHFGVGHTSGPHPDWHPMEDFRWPDQWAAFLAALEAHAGAGGVDLVLNGDTFELWQSTTAECPEHSDRELGCTEDEALGRLRRIAHEHARSLASLRAFAEKPTNRVFLVPGNHDAGILYPNLQGELATVLGPEVKIQTRGYWLADDRTVLAEHGHEIGEDLNRMEGWPRPFRQDGQGRSHLYRPWGEYFVLTVFDPYELDHPVVDNISSYWTGVQYIWRAERPGGGLKGVGRFLKFVLLDSSRGQLMALLGDKDVGEITWKVDELGGAEGPTLADLAPSDAPYASTLRQAVAGQALGFGDFDEDELRLLCDAHYLRWQKLREREPTAAASVRLCPSDDTDLGRLAEALSSKPGEVMARHLQQRRAELRNESWDGRFETFVWSHTHRTQAPWAPDGAGWNVVVVNSGAWQRVISAEEMERRLEAAEASAAGASDDDEDRLAAFRMRPEDLPRCYSFVALEPGRERKPSVLFWSFFEGEDGTGSWAVRRTCPDDRHLEP